MNATWFGRSTRGGFERQGVSPCERLRKTYTTNNTAAGFSTAQQFNDPPPSDVPGPLPLFGAPIALGYSRRLSRRLRSHSGAAAPAAQA